jgi:hypothetical protein
VQFIDGAVNNIELRHLDRWHRGSDGRVANEGRVHWTRALLVSLKPAVAASGRVGACELVEPAAGHVSRSWRSTGSLDDSLADRYQSRWAAGEINALIRLTHHPRGVTEAQARPDLARFTE